MVVVAISRQIRSPLFSGDNWAPPCLDRHFPALHHDYARRRCLWRSRALAGLDDRLLAGAWPRRRHAGYLRRRLAHHCGAARQAVDDDRVLRDGVSVWPLGRRSWCSSPCGQVRLAFLLSRHGGSHRHRRAISVPGAGTRKRQTFELTSIRASSRPSSIRSATSIRGSAPWRCRFFYWSPASACRAMSRTPCRYLFSRKVCTTPTRTLLG